MKKIALQALVFLFMVSCQTKEEKAISSFKKEINKEFVKYNSYISSFKNSLENLGIKEFDVIANDSIPSEYSNSLNDYWILGTNDEYVMQNINDIERNMSIADSISTKIITLNDSLVKYNVSDSLINLKFSEIKVNNKKILQAKYYNSEVKRLLKLKDDFYNTIENIVVDGGWKTTGYLFNKQSSMKFYKYEEGFRFMLRYGGLITDGYSYKETTGEEVYNLSNPSVFLYNIAGKNEDVFYINILEWRATGFSSSANGGRISFDTNIGNGSKLQIRLSDENGKATFGDGNYIRYWFGNNKNSYYGTYKLEGKQKDIVNDFFNLNSAKKYEDGNIETLKSYAKAWGLDLEQLDKMEEGEIFDHVDKKGFWYSGNDQRLVEKYKTRNIIKLEDKKIIENELGEDYYNLEFKDVDLNEFINDFTNDIESNKGSVKISYTKTDYFGEISTSNIVIGENNEIKSDRTFQAPNGKINSIELVTTSIGNLYKFNYTYEHEYSRGTETVNADMYILSGGSSNHSYVWTNDSTAGELSPSKIN